MSDNTATPTDKKYAIMRVERIRELGEMRRVEQHNTREKLSENVEPGGPVPRELLPDGPDDVLDRARERMTELGLVISKVEGSVGVEVVLTTSHSWWITATEQMKQDWIAANLAWLDAKFGRALLSAKLHEDEKTPHIHAVALAAVNKVDGVRGPKPKTDEGWARRRAEEEKRKARWRWNYRDLFGKDFDQLSLEQDRYHAAVAHLGLERGERGQDVTDVTLDNGVIVPANEMYRGKRSDGRDRPRGRMTTKQYQQAARDDRARAAEVRRQAEQEREAAQVARASVEADQATSIATRAEAARLARQADDDRRATAAARAEADRRLGEQTIAFAQQQRDISDLRAAAIADSVAAERLRLDAEAYAIAIRNRAEADAATADRMRREAEVVHAVAISEREASAAARRKLDDQQALHLEQIALLGRAMDDKDDLDIRSRGDTFEIGPGGLSDSDRALIARGWSPALHKIGRILADARDRLRRMALDFAARERTANERDAMIDAREIALSKDRAVHEANLGRHRDALVDLARRREELSVEVARAAETASLTASALASAKVRQADADTALYKNQRWMQVMDALEKYPDAVDVIDGGRLRLAPNIAGASPKIASAFQEPPPAWVLSLVIQRVDLAETVRRAKEHEQEAAYASERLDEMIKRAGPLLSPSQHEVVQDASGVVRRFGPRRDGPER